ncbi:MAG: hypothetical protein ACI81R_002679 [Bradymonadia bacterium]|jgi:hypothetical protein
MSPSAPAKFRSDIPGRTLFALSLLLLGAGCARGNSGNAAGSTPPGADPSMESMEGSSDRSGQGVAASEAGEGVGVVVVEAEPQEAEAPSEPAAPVLLGSAAGHGPLPEHARELFWGSVEDDAPELLNATRPDLENRHYLTCDEVNLHTWYERVRNLGGGYAGVGSDQAYTFIGWMRPELAWLSDYDPWIRALHRSYHAFFQASEDIETFLSWWSDDTEDEAGAYLAEHYAEHPDLEMILLVYSEARYKISRRLRRYGRTLDRAGVPSFITDEETYQFVRSMVANGRVRPLISNLLDDEALRGIGEVGRELGVPLRVLYMSNAEDYWEYPDTFRENMRQLHFDEQSLILRSNATKSRNGDYRYNAQSSQNFVQWLNQPYVEDVEDIWVHESVRAEDHIPSSYINEAPEER